MLDGDFVRSAGLGKVINQLYYTKDNKQSIVVIEAGIATEGNLVMIYSKGYHYLCVSRPKLKNYAIDTSRLTVRLETKAKYNIVIKK